MVEERSAAAAEAEGVDFETLVEQLYELLLTLLGLRDAATGKTYAALLHGVLQRLLHHTVTFMQARRPPPPHLLRCVSSILPPARSCFRYLRACADDGGAGRKLGG